ncbi:neuraminidase NanP, partial [Escherichia coli]
TYPGDRFAPLYLEWQIDKTIKPKVYPVKIKVYRAHLTSQEECLLEKNLTIEVDAFTFPKEYLETFHLNMWQQPSNLARTFDVPLWSDAHFD